MRPTRQEERHETGWRERKRERRERERDREIKDKE